MISWTVARMSPSGLLRAAMSHSVCPGCTVTVRVGAELPGASVATTDGPKVRNATVTSNSAPTNTASRPRRVRRTNGCGAGTRRSAGRDGDVRGSAEPAG
ncbi:MAG: hypothetical protein ACR2FL_01665 [Nocardioidaceae bacterium]